MNQIFNLRLVLDQFLFHHNQLARVLLKLFEICSRGCYLLILLLQHVQSIIQLAYRALRLLLELL